MSSSCSTSSKQSSSLYSKKLELSSKLEALSTEASTSKLSSLQSFASLTISITVFGRGTSFKQSNLHELLDVLSLLRPPQPPLQRLLNSRPIDLHRGMLPKIRITNTQKDKQQQHPPRVMKRHQKFKTQSFWCCGAPNNQPEAGNYIIISCFLYNITSNTIYLDNNYSKSKRKLH